MIANDTQIREYISKGIVEGARESNIQPHSLDVRLSHHPLQAQEGCWNGYQPIINLDPIDPNAAARTEAIPWRRDEDGQQYIIMPPGCAWLGSTHERVHVPHDMVMTMVGCSTLGRNFLQVHMTAGHIDAGFSGRITLELLNAGSRPLILRPLMRIGQLLFMPAPTAEHPYDGRYQHQHAPTAARDKRMSHKQVPVLEPPKTLRLYEDMAVGCATVNGIPRIYIPYGVGVYTPALFAWAQQRQSVRDELAARGITVLSGMTELNDKTMRSIAWDDMQRYINGEVD